MITVKRGDTLAFIVRRKNKDGTPRTGEALKLKSQLRTQKDFFLAEFIITETIVPGDYLFKVSAVETTTWSPGTYNCDIQFNEDDIVQSSETFQVIVTKDVTRDEQ